MAYISHPLESNDYPPSEEHQLSNQSNVWPSQSNTTASTPDLQLIHPAKECDDCFGYALHIEATLKEQSLQNIHQPSTYTFNAPMHTQPSLLGAEGTFHEGIALGRRLQREDDDNSFAQYRLRLERLERAEAERDELRRHRFRAEALEQELALVKDTLLAAQMAYDDLAQTLYNGSSGSKCPQCDASPLLRDVSRDNEDAGGGQSVAAPSRAPISDPVRSAPEVAVELWEDVNDFPDIKKTSHQRDDYLELSPEDSEEDAFLLEQLQALDPRDLEEFWADYRHQHESDDDEPHISEETVQESGSIIKSQPSVPQTDIHHGELSIAQIAELIAEADADLESDAAQVINLLYEDAERTAKEDRTPGQVYMLLSWIPPKFEDAIGTSIGVPPSDKGKAKAVESSKGGLLRLQPSRPQISALSPVRQNEIFVDASPQGIGFIYGDQWLAWRFSPGHPSIPGSSPKSRTRSVNTQINMSWAEIIAAELGIRTLISAGLRDCTVTLRSDNGGVVKALKSGKWTSRWGLDVILARVLRLCQSAGLKVVPVWVWGKMNPADAPSRGVYPPKERMMRSAPIVPPYLAGLVSVVCQA